MEFFVALLLLWLVVIVVGHGSYVFIRGLVALLSGDARPTESSPGRSSDLEVTKRVIWQLSQRGMLSDQDVAKIRAGLSQLTLGQPIDTVPQPNPIGPSSNPVSSHSDRSAPPSRSTTAEPTRQIPSQQFPSQQIPSQQFPSHRSTLDQDVAVDPNAAIDGTAAGSAASSAAPRAEHDADNGSPGEQVDADQPSEPIVTAQIVAEESPPSVPILSRAEIIRSFLAANNIRWGELVAGLLIVVCSIGLVISLWNTITEHRFVPSMIFLGANAAIYAAGFYTLSRWRLRHTSRAVLAIATLLVPLTVLAGIAAAGNGSETVQLTDPLTMLVLGVAGAVYGCLVHYGGSALARKPYALPILLAVAGPAAVIPLLPAAVRNFGPQAGWIVAVASLSVLASLSRTVRMRRRSAQPIGRTGGRSRILVIGFAAFSTMVTVGFAAFVLRDLGQAAIMNLAFATMPAIIAMAAAGLSLTTGARHQTQVLLGSVLSVVSLGLVAILLPPATAEFHWLWIWAITSAISFAVAAWSFREPRWAIVASLPIGITATLTSTVWIGDQTWDTVGIWTRCFAGEPMLAAALVSLALAGLRLLFRSNEALRGPIGIAAIGWSLVATLIATALSIAPLGLLGVVPWWLVTAVLIAGVTISVLLAQRQRWIPVGTMVGTTFIAVSIFRPLGQESWFQFDSQLLWIQTLLVVAAGHLLLSEFAHRFIAVDQERRRILPLWNHGACVASTLAAGIACSIVSDGWSTSAIYLACASALLFWSSTLSTSSAPLIACQSATVGLAVVIGYGRYWELLFDSAAWRSGAAAFGWVIMLSIPVAFWLGLRQLGSAVGAETPSPVKRIGNVLADLARNPEGPRTPLGLVLQAAASLIAIAAVWSFVEILAGASGPSLVVGEMGWQLPTLAFASIALLIGWVRYQGYRGEDTANESLTDSLAVVTAGSFAVWVSTWIASVVARDSQVQLVIATSISATLSVAVGSGWMTHSVRWLKKARPWADLTAVLVVVASSVVLLKAGWFEPILRDQLADRFITLAVASWAAMGTWVLYVRGLRSVRSIPMLGSALLAPAAAFLIVPTFSQTHPIVWGQFAGLISAVWWLVAHWTMKREQIEAARSAIEMTRAIVMILGIGTAVVATAQIVFSRVEFEPVHHWAGVGLSLIAVGYWCRRGLSSSRDRDDHMNRLPLLCGIALLAGPVAWLASQIGIVDGVGVVELVAAIWLTTAIACLFRHDQQPFAAAQIVAVSLGLLAIDGHLQTMSIRTPAIAVAGLGCVGSLVAFAGWSADRSSISRVAYRTLGWYVIIAGCYLLTARCGLPSNEQVFWTTLIGWTSLWVVLWRGLSSRTSTPGGNQAGEGIRLLPDVEFTLLLALSALIEALMTTATDSDLFALPIGDPLFLLRMVSFVLAAASVIFVAGRPTAWTVSLAIGISVVSMLSAKTSIEFAATQGQRFAAATLSAAFSVAILAHVIRPIAYWMSRLARVSGGQISSALAIATWRTALAIAGFTGWSVVLMIADQLPPAEINMTIVGVALAGWAIAMIADSADHDRLRHLAMAVALVAIGLWASVNPTDPSYPYLITSMRWLVATVVVIPTLLFALPRLLGSAGAQRWQGAMARGAQAATIVAGLSLVSMLVQEALLRTSDGIAGISAPLVIGVAVTLAALSLLAGWVAIVSGPRSAWRERLDLSDRMRVGLIYLAQAMGAITWLHVFLCKTQWAFVGVRGYWPFIVMGLAFISVGATEWARRRGDVLLSRTLKETALYLPLVPVIGFWFGFDVDQLDWVFSQGPVRYDVLLAIGAAYYIAIASLWKEVAPRVAAVVLGNAAWWIVLVQQDGWGFLSHPQMWLIPPAVCVLVCVHLYRDRLQPKVVAAIRYSATLVIYISSTADMLLQQIGQSIAGPIVLILLALAGMSIGVILRIRPFLYLGAMFVLVGVTSMVWHAATSIDQVWPWWVFGITAGVSLLAGLMAVEKNKPKLRHYANELSAWRG